MLGNSQEIQKFFVDYMINDTLGAISTAHLVHADREPKKALSKQCLELATLHSMAVDFAKTGAPAEMPRVLKPKEFPDFMERADKPMYISQGALGKLYRAATIGPKANENPDPVWSYDHELEVDNFEALLETAKFHKELYAEKMTALMNFYGAESEDEMLTGNLRKKSAYLQRDNRRLTEMKDRILISVKSLQKEAKEWLYSSCKPQQHPKMASAWYHVTYHPAFSSSETPNFLSFPWIMGEALLLIKSANRRKAEAPNESCCSKAEP